MGVLLNIKESLRQWSLHPRAPYLLAGLSFVEASFFPIPPDFLLIPMTLAKPSSRWWYVFYAALFSILGGLFGYCLGATVFPWISPWIIDMGYGAQLIRVHQWFLDWGVLTILVAGLTPFPYKCLTLMAGAMHLPLIWFFLASCISRGGRYFVVSLATVKTQQWGHALLHTRSAYYRWITAGAVALSIGVGSWCWVTG